MQFFQKLAVTALTVASVAAVPASGGPGRGKGHDRGHFQHSQAGHCPPGLAKKNPPCVPPGQVRQYDDRYGSQVGEVLRIGNYAVIRDPRRLNLQSRDDWRYYRDGDRAYRVDRDTRKILSIINLIDAFTN